MFDLSQNLGKRCKTVMNTIRFFSPIRYLYEVRSELSYYGKIFFEISFYLVYTVEHVYSSL